MVELQNFLNAPRSSKFAITTVAEASRGLSTNCEAVM